MAKEAFRTKWKFVVEFEDEESTIGGTIGQAESREECETLLEFEMQYHASHERIVLNGEAAEVCAECGGEGCETCGGRKGAISNLTTFDLGRTEFLLIRRGHFSGPLSPRRAA